MTVSTDRRSETRERLLHAGGEVFADKGFRDATVRDIVGRAEANIAAVNYHFGGKAELYAAVLDHACERLGSTFAVPAEALTDAEPATRLQRFLHAFLARLGEESASSWHFRLMVREMASPSPEGQRFSPQVLLTPVQEHLTRLARELEPALPPGAATLCAGSILAQCFHFRHARRFLGLPPGEPGTALLVEHIMHFSLGGLSRRSWYEGETIR